MSNCFVCDGKLGDKNTRMATNITPYSNVPYIEKISELLGEEFVIVVNDNDYLCQNCTSMLSQIDKLESDLKLVKNAMMSLLQNKYEIMPLGHVESSIQNTEELNENLMANKQQTLGQLKLPSGVPVKKIPTIVLRPVKNQVFKIQPQQNQKPQQVQNKQQFQKQQDEPNSKKIKLSPKYVQLQKFTYLNVKEPENQIFTQTSTTEITLVPPNKSMIYRCQLCFKSFNSQLVCIDHIQKEHKKSDTLISNKEREIKHSCMDTVNISNLYLTTKKKNQKVKSLMDKDNNEQHSKNGTSSTDTMLNDKVPVAKYADTELEEGTDNFSKPKIVKVIKVIKKSKSVKVEPKNEKKGEEEKNKEEEEEEEEDKNKEDEKEEDKEIKKKEDDKEDAANLEKEADTPIRLKNKVIEDSENLKCKKVRFESRKITRGRRKLKNQH